ncbi:hypothetical protein AHAS_Ahas03G0245200 [Arachis hypogaea]
MKNVAYIYGLPTDDHVISGRTDSNFSYLIDECMDNFGIPSDKNDHISSAFKLSWIRKICDAKALDTPESMQRYV